MYAMVLMQNPFDRGSTIRNMEELFGKFNLGWFLPTKPPLEEMFKSWNKLEYGQD